MEPLQASDTNPLVFDTLQIFDFLKVDSDTALLPSCFNW